MRKMRTEIFKDVLILVKAQVFTHSLDSDDFTIRKDGLRASCSQFLILIQDFHNIVNHAKYLYNIGIQVHPTASNDLFAISF